MRHAGGSADDIERREPLPEKYLYGTSWQVAEPNNVLVVVPAGTKRMRFELQVDPDADQRWTTYAASILGFSAVSMTRKRFSTPLVASPSSSAE